jgi:hypothetical protein
MGGQTNVHDEERSGQPSVVSVDQNICERQCFTNSELLCEFPQILHTLLYEIITVRLDYHKFCTRWVSKVLMGAYKMHRMALALVDFLTVIPQRWR